jgi:hypothetical protein
MSTAAVVKSLFPKNVPDRLHADEAEGDAFDVTLSERESRRKLVVTCSNCESRPLREAFLLFDIDVTCSERESRPPTLRWFVETWSDCESIPLGGIFLLFDDAFVATCSERDSRLLRRL